MRIFLCGFLIAVLLLPTATYSQASTITVSAPIGTITTATLTVDRRNQPAGTVYLYEALPNSLTAQRPSAPQRVIIPTFATRIEPELQHNLDQNPSITHSMIVYLNDQADLSMAYGISDWAERGETVYRLLTDHAQRSQQPLIAMLKQQGYAPESLWIVNAVIVEGDANLATLLSQRRDIASITSDHQTMREPEPASTSMTNEPVAWGIDKIRAPQVWSDWGVQGAGIVVANIDTGVYMTHTALLQNYRGWSAGGISHDYNWYDPAANQPVPTDIDGHGTHTMGTMVGRETATTPAIGVAPQARWIAARACVGAFCNESELIKAAEWMLAPTRVGCQKNPAIPCNPRPDLRPHIINNSWGAPGESNWFQGYITAWQAAGMVGIFAGGNYGRQGCRTSTNPGNGAGVFSVGATNPNDTIADFSSRGPIANGQTTPDISAPGVDIPSTWFDGTIHMLSGTSMATPHVAGAAALLWSANPTLIGDQARTEALLTQNSLARYSSECGDSATARPNSVYGWGRLDAYASVQAGQVDVPWLNLPASVNAPANSLTNVTLTFDARQVPAPGSYNARILIKDNGQLSAQPITFNVNPAANTSVVRGTVLDFWNGTGIYATLNFAGGPTIRTNPNGEFTLVLSNGSYQTNVSALGYRGESVILNAPEAAPTIGIYLIPKIPVMRATAPPIQANLAFGAHADFAVQIRNDGLEPLEVNATVPFQDWSIDDTQSAPWYNMASFAALPLADDMVYTDALDLGFDASLFGSPHHQIYVSSNGWASMKYQKNGSPGSSCLPSGSLPDHSFAPFWADLDPSQGGAIRAGKVAADTFVISYEAVPLWQDPAITTTLAPTFTFQLNIHADGRVQYHYKDMRSLPARWSVGMQTSATAAQALACHNQPQDLADRTLTMLNQANAQLWLMPTPAKLTIAPQQTAIVTATLRGFGYTPWRNPPAEAMLHLQTNDPRQPTLDIPAQVKVGAPPFSLWLPIINR